MAPQNHGLVWGRRWDFGNTDNCRWMRYSWCYLATPPFLPVNYWLCACAKRCSIRDSNNQNRKIESLYRMVLFLFLSFLHHIDFWKKRDSLPGLGNLLRLWVFLRTVEIMDAGWASTATAPGPGVKLWRKPGKTMSEVAPEFLAAAPLSFSMVSQKFNHSEPSQDMTGNSRIDLGVDI